MINPPQLDNSAVNDPDHATPPCPHFGPCGGCQLQHLTYPAQLDLKANHLRSLLASNGIPLPELRLHPSPPLAYRNRIRLTLAEVDGQLRAGYIRKPATAVGPQIIAVIPTKADHAGIGEVEGPPHFARSASEAGPAFLPIHTCPIAAPVLWRATEALLALIDQNPTPWNAAHLAPDQLELFTTADESTLQFTLYLRAEIRAAKTVPANLGDAFAALCESLRTHIPELTGAGISLLPPLSNVRSRRTEQPRLGPSWGAPGLTYSIPAPQPATSNRQPATAYWVPRGAFFQINRFLLPDLLALVTSNSTGPLAWDLYAGVGLFSRALARTFAQVVAVEIAEPAASALASTKLANLRAAKSTTLDFLRAAVLQRERPSLIVLDPPRSGAGTEVCALLARIAAPALIYISCSPEALARDLTALAASGYSVAELHLVDLFPQSTHIETVAILTRRKAGQTSHS
jgi:23S rRNA (uracil1939-C5)-methyltransferase